MINPKELLFVVDENNNPQEPLPREEVHKKGIWHRSAHIWVINSKRQILCQKRSMNKDILPGKWEMFFGGHLLAGENELDTAVTEAFEELGIKADAKDLIPFGVVKAQEDSGFEFTHRQFQYVYILKRNLEIRKLHFEEEEIDEVKWFNLEQLRKILLEDKPKDWVRPVYVKEILEHLK